MTDRELIEKLISICPNENVAEWVCNQLETLRRTKNAIQDADIKQEDLDDYYAEQCEQLKLEKQKILDACKHLSITEDPLYRYCNHCGKVFPK